MPTPLYREATSQSSSLSQEAEKASQKAWEMIKERFEKDPILSSYQDAVSLEVIRDPVEAVLTNGQSAYHDKSSKEALQVGKKDPSMHVPIQKIKKAPHIKAYLTKRKEQICNELVLGKSQVLKEAIEEKKLVEATFVAFPIWLEEFFEAAENGDLNGIRGWLSRKNPINVMDNGGRTALMLAAWRDHLHVVQYLAGKKGIDLNEKDNDGRTALMYAALNGKLDVVRVLAELAENENPNEIRRWRSWEWPIDAKDNGGRTALMLAAEHGHLDVVQYLAEKKGIDFNAKDNSGWTALMYAALNGKIDVVRVLVEKKGIELNAEEKYDGKTALMLAAEQGHLDVVRVLAEKK
ncbi:MAG: ankyrin repeat domain-containing protein, partial [Chlamydiae bacterium]|nr:ankyrin repeat domain-containing protein [Chlamydiota bacterium]